MRLFLVLSGLTLAVFLMLLDASIVATVSLKPTISQSTAIVPLVGYTTYSRQAAPRITSDFHSLNDIGWYGTAYLLAK